MFVMTECLMIKLKIYYSDFTCFDHHLFLLSKT